MGTLADGTWDGVGVDPNDPGVIDDGANSALVGSDPYTDLAGERQDADPITFTGYTPPEDDASVTGGLDYYTPETTIANQLEGILKKGSPLQDLAESRSREQASALGMSSSSGAIGAGQRALYDSAFKVAEGDAKTAAGFMGQQQGIEGEISKVKQEALVSGSLNQQKAALGSEQKAEDDFWSLKLKGVDVGTEQEAAQFALDSEKTMSVLQGEVDKSVQQDGLDIKGGWDQLLMGMDTQGKLDMVDLQGGWDETMKGLDADLAVLLQKGEIDALTAQKLMDQSHEAMNDYQISVQQLLGNQSFLDDMGGDASKMRSVFDNMLSPVIGALRFSAKTVGLNDNEMQWYINVLSQSGRWDGGLDALSENTEWGQ